MNIFTKYCDNPVKFVTEILGAKSYTGRAGPDPLQCDVLDALAEYRLVCVRSPHGVGKTALCAMAVHWYLCTHPFSKIPMCAPTFAKQVKGMLFAELHSWARRSLLREMINATTTKMSIIGAENEWFAEGIAIDDPDKAEGYHGSGGTFYIFDEAKGIPKKLWDSARGALTGPEDRMLAVSTPPLAPIGEFVRVFTHLRTTWKTFAFGSTPRQSKEWRKEREREWPVGSPEHTAKILGEIPRSSVDSTVIPLGLIEAAMARVPSAKDYEGSNRLGVDVGSKGVDPTVIAARQGNVILPLEIFSQQDTAITAKLIEELLDYYSKVVIDEIGVGVGVVDPISHHETKAAKLQPIQVNGVSNEPEKYADLGTEMWFRFVQVLEDGLVLPYDDILASELATREFSYIWKKGHMVRKLQSKVEMKRKNIGSPDRAEAVINACVDISPAIAYLSDVEITEILNPSLQETSLRRQLQPGFLRPREDTLREFVKEKLDQSLEQKRGRFWHSRSF